MEDTYPGIYNVTKDGKLFTPNTKWTNGFIIISTGYLSIGEYNFTINVYDLTEHMVSDSVIITISEVSSQSSSTLISNSPTNLSEIKSDVNSSKNLDISSLSVILSLLSLSILGVRRRQFGFIK